jgi:hydrogenase nickel incorporation protein HypA/HybF
MHEMGIAMQIVEISTASIPADLMGAQVEKVNVKIGKLSAVVPESLRFCFQIVSQDTPLCNASLIIEEIPIVIKCLDCNIEWTIDEPIFSCQKCNGGAVDIVSGRELDISSIEIAERDE